SRTPRPLTTRSSSARPTRPGLRAVTPAPTPAGTHIPAGAAMTRYLLTLLALAIGGPALAAESTITALAAYPTALTLRGSDDAAQLVITGKRADGRDVDLTGAVTYSVSDPKVIRVEPSGRVIPLSNGTAAITATANGMSVNVPVMAEKMET